VRFPPRRLRPAAGCVPQVNRRLCRRPRGSPDHVSRQEDLKVRRGDTGHLNCPPEAPDACRQSGRSPLWPGFLWWDPTSVPAAQKRSGAHPASPAAPPADCTNTELPEGSTDFGGQIEQGGEEGATKAVSEEQDALWAAPFCGRCHLAQARLRPQRMGIGSTFQQRSFVKYSDLLPSQPHAFAKCR
jgi:hypothetical protein